MFETLQRRHRLRLPVKLPATISSNQGRGMGVVTDLSMRGCALETEIGLHEGAAVDLQVLVPNEESAIVVNAVVRGVHAPRRMGVEFVDLTPAETARLSRFVFRLWKASEIRTPMAAAPRPCQQDLGSENQKM